MSGTGHPERTGDAEPIHVLHVIGGLTLAGGANTFVTGLVNQGLPGIRQSIWVHRDFKAPDDRTPLVRRGRARRVAASMWCDARAVLLDVVPLATWARGQRRLILHAHSRAGILAGAVASRLTGVPLIMHLHARSGYPGVYRRLWAGRRAVPVFNSQVTCRHFGCDPRQALIAEPPIRWPSAPRQGAPGPPRFVMASAFVRLKNLHWVTDAFNRLVGEGTEAELRIFGLSRSPLDPVYQQEIVDSTASNPKVTLLDYDPAWLTRLSGDDIFVHTAVIEAFGIVILEAFAQGCRVIVPKETFLDELPSPLNEEGVFRLQSLDAEGVYQQMKAAMAHGVSGGERWGHRQGMARRFSHDATAERLGPLYQSLAGGRGAAPEVRP